MLESITILSNTRFGQKAHINLGLIAEAMIFYQKVTIVADASAFKELTRLIGTDILIRLMEEGFLRLVYQDGQVAIKTNEDANGLQVMSPVQFTAPALSIEVIAPKTFVEITGKSGKGRRNAQRAIRSIELFDWEKVKPLSGVYDDFNDETYINIAARSYLKNCIPDYPQNEPITFSLTSIPGNNHSYTVKSNIDFELASKLFPQKQRLDDVKVTPAGILVDIARVRSMLNIAGVEGSELAPDIIDSEIIQLKLNNILKKSIKSGQDLRLFQEMTLLEANAIREAINKDPRLFNDFIPVLVKSRKYKSYLKGIDGNDTTLLRDYYRMSMEKTWVERLPAKSVRWALAIGFDISSNMFIPNPGIATGLTAILSAGDTFLLDKLKLGWKPSQFIEGDLKSFLEKQSKNKKRLVNE